MSFEEQAQRVSDALADRVREHVARELQAATRELHTMLTMERAAHDAHMAEQLRVSAVRAADAQLAAITAAEARGRDAVYSMADRIQRGASERLLDAFRRLDAAHSLSDILDRLADAATREADHVAVLTVQGDELQVWKSHGIDAAALILEHADVLIDVVRSGRERVVSRAASQVTPTEGAGEAAGKLLILPIKVGDTVVALACADLGNREKDEQDSPIGPVVLELLTRHAARGLQAVTASRTVQLMKE